MLARSLSDARDRGECVSILRAAEWPIYGRFGYAVASQVSNYAVHTMPRPEILPPGRPVTIAGCEPEELVAPATDVLNARILRQPGQISRDRTFWERMLGLEGLSPSTRKEPVCVLARDENAKPVGYAIWTAKDGDWFVDRAEVILHELIADTTDAYRALWRYLVGLDLVKSISWGEQAVDEPLEWLLSDGRAARRELSYDGLWLRLLDVEAALSARRYGAPDALAVEVIDDDSGRWAAGRYLLDGGPNHAECRATSSHTPDLTLSQRALAALYLGGRSVWSLREADQIEEHTTGAVDRLQRMFIPSARAPWNASPF
jgi:predicted acetyltransferase